MSILYVAEAFTKAYKTQIRICKKQVLFFLQNRSEQNMFIKIIEEIKAAEKNARDIKQKAEVSAAAVISEALLTAEEICKEARDGAKAEYDKKISEAKQTARARIDEYRRISYENAAVLTEIAEKRSEKAVDFIVDRILGTSAAR